MLGSSIKLIGENTAEGESVCSCWFQFELVCAQLFGRMMVAIDVTIQDLHNPVLIRPNQLFLFFLQYLPSNDCIRPQLDRYSIYETLALSGLARRNSVVYAFQHLPERKMSEAYHRFAAVTINLGTIPDHPCDIAQAG